MLNDMEMRKFLLFQNGAPMHSLSIKLFLLYFKHWGDKLWPKIMHHVMCSVDSVSDRFRALVL